MRSLERVHIFGAAGCGSSTLGRALAQQLECQHVDVDDVYWLATVPNQASGSRARTDAGGCNPLGWKLGAFRFDRRLG
ncbi:hypothetical protein JO965_23705 [Microvirga sp. VF16]|nr:hypothetical protein JO965_23705 [Microvirga sp. VF16]